MWLPLTCPLLRTWPTTQACVLTGHQTSDPLVHRLLLNPHQPRHSALSWYFLCIQNSYAQIAVRMLLLWGRSCWETTRRQRANSKARGLLKECSQAETGSHPGGSVQGFWRKKNVLWGSSLVIGYFGIALLSSFSYWVFLSCSFLVPGTIIPDPDYLGAVPPWSVCTNILFCWLGCFYARSDQTVSYGLNCVPRKSRML